jgi:hypothetical protein
VPQKEFLYSSRPAFLQRFCFYLLKVIPAYFRYPSPFPISQLSTHLTLNDGHGDILHIVPESGHPAVRHILYGQGRYFAGF